MAIFGSKELASEIIKGEKSINKQIALKLGKKFNLDPALFLF